MKRFSFLQVGSRKAAPMSLCKLWAPQWEWCEELHKAAAGQALVETRCVCACLRKGKGHTQLGDIKQKRNPSVGRAVIVRSEVMQGHTAIPSENALLQWNFTRYNVLPLLKRHNTFLSKNYQWKYSKRSYFASGFNNCVSQSKENPH